MKIATLAFAAIAFPHLACAVDVKYGAAGDDYVIKVGTLLCFTSAGVAAAMQGVDSASDDWFASKGCVRAKEDNAGKHLIRVLPENPDHQDIWRMKLGNSMYYTPADRFDRGPVPGPENPYGKQH